MAYWLYLYQKSLGNDFNKYSIKILSKESFIIEKKILSRDQLKSSYRMCTIKIALIIGEKSDQEHCLRFNLLPCEKKNHPTYV